MSRGKPRSADARHVPMGRGVIALALIALAWALPACADPPGNDPNVADMEPPGTVMNLGGPAMCPPAAPASCPAAPSYAKDIAPLVKRSCLPCHSPGQQAADRDLTSYANFVRLETTDFVQVDACLMPPADAGPDAAMSIADRTEMLQWFVCGAPDN